MLPKISYKIVFNFLFEILKNNDGVLMEALEAKSLMR